MTSPAVSPVFVGRRPELARLADALRDADAGVPAVVLIAGEAGVGKSRLLHEFLAQVAHVAPAGPGHAGPPYSPPGELAPGHPVAAIGACVELGAEGLPFAPVSAAMRMLSARMRAEVEAAAAGREQDLAWLLPDLAQAPPARQHSGLERARMFELTLGLLERLARGRTLIVALEDLHWADASTRELLSFLIRSLRGGRILILATYRADAIDRAHPMRPFLAELDRARAVRRVDLDRLTRAEVAEQLRGILGAEPPRHLVRQVFAKSEGNAFFVEELACGIQDGKLTGLSDSLRDLLLVRVEQLSETTQRVVRLAAVGGSTVGHRLIGEVAELPPDELEDALRGALSAHVLVRSADGDGYQFRHALVREAVRDDLLPGERMRTHARFAEALERRPDLVAPGDLAGRRATYWYHAGRPAKALPTALEAAATARARYAYGEQLRLLERALELWGQVEDPEGLTGRTELELLEEAIPSARLDNRHELALSLVRQALNLVDEDTEPRRAASLWSERARLLRSMARSHGLPELRKAESLLVGLPPSREHAEVLAQLARGQMLDGAAHEALERAEAALRVAGRAGGWDLEAVIGRTLGCTMVSLGRVDEGLAAMTRAAEVARNADDAEALSALYGNLASVLEGLGRHQEAVDQARRGLRIAREHGLLRNIGSFGMGNLAEGLLSLGAWDELEQVADEALDQDPIQHTAGHLARLMADLSLARGDLGAAATHLERASLAVVGKYTEPQFRIPLRAAEVTYARRLGRVAEVREITAGEIEAGFPPGHQRYAWPLLVEAMRAEGDLAGTPATAAESAERAAARERVMVAADGLDRHCDLDRAHAATLAAEHARALGEDRAADWEAAVLAWEKVEQPYRRAVVLARWAAALVAEGDRAGAARALARAHEVAVRLGASPLREETELLARRARVPLGADAPAGAPAPEAAADGRPALTPREREVLRLLVDGHSNRRIAEELFISVKTASVHVSNILAKLEVPSRGEAAALARRLNLLAGG